MMRNLTKREWLPICYGSAPVFEKVGVRNAVEEFRYLPLGGSLDKEPQAAIGKGGPAKPNIYVYLYDWDLIFYYALFQIDLY